MKPRSTENHTPQNGSGHQLADSFMLGQQDVRAMVRLLGDIAGLDAEQSVKRRELMRGMRTLIDADAWVWTVSQLSPDDGRMTSISLMHEGFSEMDDVRVIESETDPAVPTPDGPLWTPFFFSSHPMTRQRQQMIDDTTWYEHPHTKKYRQGFIDDYAYSFTPLGNADHRIASIVAFHRRWGRPPFTQRDARIIHIMSSEVRWLHEAAVPGDGGKKADGLSPRLRTILALILQSYSRKQMAHHLTLSIHTINDYFKALYKHFNVSSGPELMRRFMAGDSGDINKITRAK
mgnify:CR=1 FL=1